MARCERHPTIPPQVQAIAEALCFEMAASQIIMTMVDVLGELGSLHA